MSKPRQQPKSKVGWYLFIAAGVGLVLFVYSGGDDTPTTTKKPPLAKPSSSSTDSDYIPADYKVTYPPMKDTPKDVFVPLVTKATVGGAAGPNGLPAYVTGGDANWQYTGMVQINGADQALLEEQKTGDSVYLTVGQHWKRGKIKRISDSDVQLEGDNGKLFTVKMSEGESKRDNIKVAENSNPNSPVDVATPALTGPIGSTNVDLGSLPAVQIAPNGGNGGGFRGRGRGGRRFGGGFGGGG